MALVWPGLRAQGTSLGTFRWQLQPYCNVLTVAVVQQGTNYHVDGSDDQCGASRLAGVVGLAFVNPDGRVGLGLTTVTTPGGTPIHIDAVVSPASGNGTWRDSAGNTGTFALTPGAGTSGAPRPVPPGGIAPGSITNAQLAPGSIGAANLAAGAVAAGLAGLGSCGPGQYLRGVGAGGALVCTALTPPTSTTLPFGEGFYIDMAIGRDGLPVISHYDASAEGLRVTHCGNMGCTAGNVSTLVDHPPAKVVGLWTSLAIGSDGVPVIAHADATARTLRLTHCGDPTCAAGATTVEPDPVSGGSAIAFRGWVAIGADGLPVLSHSDLSGRALRVTHCGNVTCSAGSTSTTIVQPAGSGGFVSSGPVAIGGDGLAVVSHTEVDPSVPGGPATLYLTRCTNQTCTAATAVATLQGVYNVALGGLAIGSDGWPFMTRGSHISQTLDVTHCATPTCSTFSVTLADAPAGGNVGRDSDVAIGTDGLPVISHWDYAAQALRVTHCGNLRCQSGNISTTVDDPAGAVGSHTAIAVGVDGFPVIAHRDATAQALRVTKCYSRDCR